MTLLISLLTSLIALDSDYSLLSPSSQALPSQTSATNNVVDEPSISITSQMDVSLNGISINLYGRSLADVYCSFTFTNRYNESDIWEVQRRFHTNNNPPRITIYVVLFDPQNPDRVTDLKYGSTYDLTSAIRLDTNAEITDITGEIIIEPERSRLLSVSCIATSTKAYVQLRWRLTPNPLTIRPYRKTMTGNALPSDTHKITPVDDETGYFIIDVATAAEKSDNPFISFHNDYFSLDSSGTDTCSLNCSVPPPVEIDQFVPTTELSGRGLTLDINGTNMFYEEAYMLSFDLGGSKVPIEIRWNGPDKMTTVRPIPLGWSDSLQFSTTYTNINLSHEKVRVYFLQIPKTLTTPDPPPTITLYVAGSLGNDHRLCGEPADPCRTLEMAFKIVVASHTAQATLLLLGSLEFSSCHETQDGISLTLQPDTIGVSTQIRIPSSVDTSPGPLLTMTSGTLKLSVLSISVGTVSDAFCLVCGVGTTIELFKVDVHGPSLPTSFVNEEWSLCSWETGLFKMKGGSAVVNGSSFKLVPQGVFWMDGGSLNLDSYDFSNPVRDSPFTSAERNIRCVNEGTISIAMNGNTNTQSKSLWISSDSCLVAVDGTESLAPLFVPTLSTSKCSSTRKKSSDALTVTLSGSSLIPCGLSFEVFEADNSTSNEQPRSSSFLLSETPLVSSKDDELIFLLNDSVLNFSKSVDLHGRLLFGLDQETESFVVRSRGNDPFSQNARKLMSWLIPLVSSLVLLAIVIVVIFVILWRRKKNQERKDEEMQVQVEVEDDKMEVIVTDNRIGVNPSNTCLPEALDQDVTTKEEALPSVSKFGKGAEVDVFVCDQGVNMISVPCVNTLFNRLHSPNGSLNLRRRMIQAQIVQGLKTLTLQDRTAAILSALSSHNILFDSNDRVCFSVNADQVSTFPTLQQSPVPSPQIKQEVGNVDSEGKNQHSSEHMIGKSEFRDGDERKMKEGNENQRWQAPVVIEKKPNINTVHAAVFSLGLVLWEIETGSVPYGEQDAVNASRQIVAGTLPRMDFVLNSEMSELIRDCLAMTPKERPSLSDVLGRLDEIPEEKDDGQKELFEG
ncbi:hypothetical protein BLNAU_17754 [Blattamonas nauphoetae]|uniref:Protein kinase domain-containing protein n=1 Tax=Blattamonas nauphoetae TaxID=2049346 RepID=A0ABQ9X6P6_9EUKA|nr:hypothetical protein BLNAU_17754 [Blattamonas nauphoetae]